VIGSPVPNPPIGPLPFFNLVEKPEEQEQVSRPHLVVPEVPLGRARLAKDPSPTWQAGQAISHQIGIEMGTVVGRNATTGEIEDQTCQAAFLIGDIPVGDGRAWVWNGQG
jgi:hypothetical protein